MSAFDLFLEQGYQQVCHIYLTTAYFYSFFWARMDIDVNILHADYFVWIYSI